MRIWLLGYSRDSDKCRVRWLKLNEVVQCACLVAATNTNGVFSPRDTVFPLFLISLLHTRVCSGNPESSSRPNTGAVTLSQQPRRRCNAAQPQQRQDGWAGLGSRYANASPAFPGAASPAHGLEVFDRRWGSKQCLGSWH